MPWKREAFWTKLSRLSFVDEHKTPEMPVTTRTNNSIAAIPQGHKRAINWNKFGDVSFGN
jgi:hypothetical protein